jgi:hypothetical protein
MALTHARTYIDFQKNNFTLSDPSPQIPYLKWARVRLNRDHILAFIIYRRKDLAHLVTLFFGNVYRFVKRVVKAKQAFASMLSL